MKSNCFLEQLIENEHKSVLLWRRVSHQKLLTFLFFHYSNSFFHVLIDIFNKLRIKHCFLLCPVKTPTQQTALLVTLILQTSLYLSLRYTGFFSLYIFDPALLQIFLTVSIAFSNGFASSKPRATASASCKSLIFFYFRRYIIKLNAFDLIFGFQFQR